jgi:hypothetical protein
VNDEFTLALLGDRLGHVFGLFSGGVVAELLPNVAAHDPVVEAVIRNDMNGGGRHRPGFMQPLAGINICGAEKAGKS